VDRTNQHEAVTTRDSDLALKNRGYHQQKREFERSSKEKGKNHWISEDIMEKTKIFHSQEKGTKQTNSDTTKSTKEQHVYQEISL